MVNRIRRLFTVPHFDDEDQMRVARILNFSLLVMLAGGIAFAIATPLVMPDRINRMPITITMCALILVMLYVLRTGRVRFVALFFTSALWLLFSYAALTSGGIERPGFTLQILVVVVAALTLGGTIALAFAGLSGLFGLGMYIAQQAGKLPTNSTYSLTASAMTQLVAMFAIALLLHQAARSINEALARRRQSEQMLAERNRLLESEVTERKRIETELRESQTRLTAAQLIANIGTWESDLLTGKEIWSDETRGHLGFSENDISPTFDLLLSHVHPDDRPIVERKTGETFSKENTHSTQYRVVSPDGGIRYITSRASVQFDAEGRPVKLLGITQDITHQKESEVALTESEEQLRLATDATQIGIWDWNVQTGIVKWSNHTYQIFGLAPEAFTETTIDFNARVYPDDLHVVQATLTHADANGQSEIGDFRIIHADGSIRWVYERGKVYYDAAGQPARVIGIIQDITERKQAEEQRFELAVEKERVALLKEFIGNMSHDLKTPLTVIKTSLYLLERVTDPERQQSKMETIKQQVLLLEKLIEDVLTMSQLDHTPELLLASVDLNNLLLDVEHKLRPAAENKRLSIRMELNPSIPPVLASESELYRVMVNLVENAIKYTPEMGSVAIWTRLDDTMIVTEITDTGIGISQEDLLRIFERFFRANAARSIDIPGTGLGLAIVKRIVDMHNGSIEVESTPGKGSVFRVLLPLNTNPAIQPR